LRLFIDECLSPDYSMRLGKLGHDAIHPLQVGRRGQSDAAIKAPCIAEDRVIITENVGDFRGLLGREPIHPGLIALPQTDKETAWRLLIIAIGYLEALSGNPMDHMINHILEVDGSGRASLHPLP
jgi:predicted nuclease of predicted toxin-antitoxin system